MRPLLPILLALLLAAPAAHAAPRLAGLPRVAHAGEIVHATWSGLEPDVREVELELSLDGGRWVRISPEMEAREGQFDWRVPEWASGIARLRLRSGGEFFERVAALSEAFAIPVHDGTPRLACRGEWWDVSVSAPPAHARHEIALAREALSETPAELRTESGALAARPPCIATPNSSLANDRDPSADREPHLRTPLHLPLRI